jgi:hypothetical protein
MKEKISSLGTEKVAKMNSPALICQPVSASDNKNPPLENERERKRARKSKLAKEGANILDLYFRILNKDKGSFENHWGRIWQREGYESFQGFQSQKR